MMKTPLTILALLAFATNAYSEEKLIDGGLSPNKEYGVYLTGSNTGDSYTTVELRRQGDQKVLRSLSSDMYTPYFDYAHEMTAGVWSADSQYLALLYRSTKTTRSLSVYAIRKEGVREIALPDYGKALGKALLKVMKKPNNGRYFWTLKAEWHGRELKVRFEGNMSDSPANPEGNPDDSFDGTIVFAIDQQLKMTMRDLVVMKHQAKSEEK